MGICEVLVLFQRPLGADMQNYIHAFQVSTTCIFNDSSAAFITFYRPSRKLTAHETATRGRRLSLIARAIVDYAIILHSPISRLGCGGSNTNKTVCNSLLELMTVSAQLGFNSWGFNNSMHRYLQKKSIHPQPVLMKWEWDIAAGEVAFYEVHRLTRFHKRGPFDMIHVIV
ncbi:hypothetical protein CAPTEDRAFT_204280 [Capitella teleta]|uniref:Uncharacterized protein n=1 Tax=Capitella teleta TaxID=283909 RepID=R7U6I6_CAPTE|nr:hypothetical protein CAPTEDRAFT_204280 [Capitella teleta]|eukprot:ELU01940.1 hypothetical protein CAPTEDRAFT_204280 [Capitella teleta]